MYQWVESKHSETKKNTGGSTDTTTTYTYTKEWEDSLISLSSFQDKKGHLNPERGMLYENKIFVADDIQVGVFLLSTGIVQKMNWWGSLADSLTVD